VLNLAKRQISLRWISSPILRARNATADLANIREGLSSPEAQRLIDERPSLSTLSKDITAAIVLLECATIAEMLKEGRRP